MPELRLFYIFNSLFIFKYLPKTSCITNKHPVSLVQFMNIVPAQHWILVSLIIVMTVITHNSANAEQTLQILPSENSFFFFPIGYIYKKGIKNGLQMRKNKAIWNIFGNLGYFCFALLCFTLLCSITQFVLLTPCSCTEFTPCPAMPTRPGTCTWYLTARSKLSLLQIAYTAE